MTLGSARVCLSNACLCVLCAISGCFMSSLASCVLRLPCCSTHELVARAVHGEDVLRLVRRRLDLLPQLRDEVVDGPRGRGFLVAPDLIEDLLAGHDLAGVRDEIPQEVEFARREVDALAGALRLVRPEIDVDVADLACLEA